MQTALRSTLNVFSVGTGAVVMYSRALFATAFTQKMGFRGFRGLCIYTGFKHIFNAHKEDTEYLSIDDIRGKSVLQSLLSGV